MKRNLCVFIAVAAVIALFVPAGSARAQSYTVTGDLSATGVSALSGPQTYTGSLSNLFDTVSGEAMYVNNNLPTGSYNDMVANQDYIVATSSTGQIATFSVGEITVGNNSVGSYSASNGSANNIQIGGSAATGFTISGPGQSLSNVTNINVVHTTMPAGSGGWSSSLTIQNNGATAATYNAGAYSSQTGVLPGSFTALTGQEAWTYAGNQYTGVSLLSMLQSAGINTNNLNQYVIATGTDGGEAVLSMAEIVQNDGTTFNNGTYTGTGSDMVAYLLNGSGLASNRGYFRLVLPTDTSSARSIFTLTSLDVVPTPVPASLLLFGPGLAGLAVLRRRFM